MSALSLVRGELDRVNGEIRAIDSAAEAESRAALTTDEAASYAVLRDERASLEAREADLVEAERRASVAAATRAAITPAPASVTVGTEPSLYRKGAPMASDSFIKDFLAARNGDMDARDKMVRNTQEVQALEARAGVTTVAGAGGEFAPPAWLISDWIALPRAGREFADAVDKRVLPGGVSSINIPTISTGTTTAVQSTQNTAVSNTDPGTSSVAVTIKTGAGYNLVSQQEIDQSPINTDDVVLSDLVRSYDALVDSALITAVAGTASIIAQTYTDASPTTVKVGNQVADAIQKVATQRFAYPSVIVMTPKRWAGFSTAVDTAGRPLVTPVATNGSVSLNTVGTNGPQAAQGITGYLWGLPVIVDPNIPVNLGAGTNQDEIFVVRASDIMLYESAPRMDTQVAPYANQLSVLVRFWRYYGIGVRTPKSVALLTGTGMIQPALGS